MYGSSIREDDTGGGKPLFCEDDSGGGLLLLCEDDGARVCEDDALEKVLAPARTFGLGV